ncbi:hypothetical protein ACHAPM_011198 [Fusarium culmorum]
MEQNVGGEVNDIGAGPQHGHRHSRTLESIRSKWANSPASQVYSLPLSRSAPKLSNNLKDLISKDVGSYRRESREKVQLREFLADQENSSIVDDCILWKILDNLAGGCEAEEESALSALLEEIIIEIRPILAFIPAIKDHCDLSALRFSNDSQTRVSFRWKCNKPSHHDEIDKRFSQATAPFLKAINLGDVSKMTHIIDSSKSYFAAILPDDGEPNPVAVKGYVDQLLGLKLSKPGRNIMKDETALEYAFRSHNEAFQCRLNGVGGESELSNHSEIMNQLLKFDRTLMTKDATFQNAIREANSDAVKLILEHAPHDFLQESTVANELTRPGENVANVLLTSWCHIKPISLHIAKRMIQAKTSCIWDDDTIKGRFYELAEDGLHNAKELLSTAIDINTPAFASEILHICPKSLDIDTAGKLVQYERSEFWELEELKSAWELVKFPELLPLAVQYQRARVVELLVKNWPGSVLNRYPGPKGTADEIDGEIEVYPLWHNNFVIEGDAKKYRQISRTENPKEAATKLNIRNTLISACTRLTENVQELYDIFQHCGESVGDISFDLSQFNSKVYPFDRFVKCLIQGKGDPKIQSHSYERTLRYADFPSLDPNAHHRGNDRYRKHTEVVDILKWLQSKQKVEEIVKLRVLDRMSNPHDEESISWAVEKFQVQHLDWRCLDLSFSVFDTPRANCLKTLHLYASGRRAVISHWLSEEGIRSLPNIEQLGIHLVKELMSRKKARDLEATLNRYLSDLKLERPVFRFKVNMESWDIHPIRSNTTLGHLAGRAVPKLWPLIQAYRNHILGKVNSGTSCKSTKVAVIDNGIMNIVPFYTSSGDESATVAGNHPFSKDHADDFQEHGEDEVFDNAAEVQEESSEDVSQALLSRVIRGQSFLADENRVGSWSFASDPHGTQMASLICAIDPHCEILVAKVTEGRFGVHSERLAMAIKWAVLQGVDIISMSLATYELGKSGTLQQAIDAAHMEGVLLLCAAHDEGLNVTKAYPSCMPETVTIAASNQFGHATDRTAKLYNYRIHATNIAVGAVPFMHCEEYISGSSVATAIAAGMSSLIISCRRLATGPIDEKVKSWKRKIVEEKFNDTIPSEALEQKYVRLDKLCGVDERTKDGAPLDMDELIQEEFGID